MSLVSVLRYAFDCSTKHEKASNDLGYSEAPSLIRKNQWTLPFSWPRKLLLPMPHQVAGARY